MSDFLRNCLIAAVVTAFGMAMLTLIFMILSVLILGAVTGPGAVVAVGVALPLLLAGSLIFGAVVFVSMVLACMISENQRSADVQAGAPGGGGQALEEDKNPPRCGYCEMIRKRLVLISSVAGVLIGVIISRV